MIEPTEPIHVYIAKSGHETGPFQQEQIRPMLDSGMLTLTDFIWHKDMAGWMPVHQYLGLRPPLPVNPGQCDHDRDHPASHGGARSGDPAPFGRRLLAHAIDLAACSCLTFLFGMMMVKVIGGTLKNPGILDYSSPLSKHAHFEDNRWKIDPDTGSKTLETIDTTEDHGFVERQGGPFVVAIGLMVTLACGVVVLVAPTWLYHSLWESSARQASVGKLSCGLVVTDMEGARITFLRASKRSMGKAVSQLLGAFGLVFLTSLLSAKKQCLHDMAAACLVVVK